MLAVALFRSVAFFLVGALFLGAAYFISRLAETVTTQLRRGGTSVITYRRSLGGRTWVRRLPSSAVVAVEHVAARTKAGRRDYVALALTTGEAVEIAEYNIPLRTRRGTSEDLAHAQAETVAACLQIPARYVDMLTVRTGLQNFRPQRDRMGLPLQRPSQAELDREFERLSRS